MLNAVSSLASSSLFSAIHRTMEPRAFLLAVDRWMGFPVADTLAKEARDGCGVAREVGQNGFGILYAGEVDDRGV